MSDAPGAVREPAAADLLRRRLLDWYGRHRRDLPWRRDPRPWPVWLSEVMCQQTRVDSVIPYWRRFVERFPQPADLAAAPLDDVLGMWAGLGYYARARNLHAAAGQVVERHGGAVPGDPDAFGALAGVGRYTKGAVMSIAFGHRLPAVDGNAVRVICRLDRLTDDPRPPKSAEVIWRRAAAVVDGERPGDVNQAIMELGATVCTPRSPTCLLCPVSDLCLAREAGVEQALPVKPKRKARPTVHRVAALARDGEGRIWLGQRPTEGLLGGLWGLPAVDAPGPDGPALRALGLEPDLETPPVTIEHGFTHLIWRVHTWPAAGAPVGDGAVRWRAFAEPELPALGLSGPSLKALRACGVKMPHRRGAGPKRGT